MRPPIRAAAALVALGLPLVACSDGGGGQACSPGPELTVHAEDSLMFDADRYEVAAGCVDISYVNDGSIAHTLRIKDVDGFKLTVGDRDEGTVQLDPGTYTLYCDLPGHEKAGMHAELTVS